MDDYIPIRRFVMPDGTNVMQTDDPSVEAALLFVNLQNEPYSEIFGQKLEKTLGYDGRKTVVLGFRKDIGTIRSIDRYYTDEMVVYGGKTVQILSPTPGAQVLCETADGKPYALKDGNLYILAMSDLFSTDGDFSVFRYAELLK